MNSTNTSTTTWTTTRTTISTARSTTTATTSAIGATTTIGVSHSNAISFVPSNTNTTNHNLCKTCITIGILAFVTRKSL